METIQRNYCFVLRHQFIYFLFKYYFIMSLIKYLFLRVASPINLSMNSLVSEVNYFKMINIIVAAKLINILYLLFQFILQNHFVLDSLHLYVCCWTLLHCYLLHLDQLIKQLILLVLAKY